VIALSITAGYIGVDLNSPGVLFAMVFAVATIGVPHGGMDHLVGRRRLRPSLGNFWAPAFLLGYLSVALLVVFGWLLCPLLTAIAFFLISAWHFGDDDETATWLPNQFRPAAAFAVGGLLIWVPALFRPIEMHQILVSILPSTLGTAADQILMATRPIAIVGLVASTIVLLLSFSDVDGRLFGFRNCLFICLFALAPIPVSFGIYFVGWHSLRGLAKLRREDDLSFRKWLIRIAPLSIAANVLVIVGAVWWGEGRSLSEELTRSLFIGLSAMAVPHLLLHTLMTSRPMASEVPNRLTPSGASS
jgi:Brp/Blh family beta-carotene 15,15'-monooxygenase